MKTLVKPLVKLNKEIYPNQLNQQNMLSNHSLQYRKIHTKWKFLLITLSFFTFIAFSDSPELDGNICNKYNHEQICNIW